VGWGWGCEGARSSRSFNLKYALRVARGRAAAEYSAIGRNAAIRFTWPLCEAFFTVARTEISRPLSRLAKVRLAREMLAVLVVFISPRTCRAVLRDDQTRAQT